MGATLCKKAGIAHLEGDMFWVPLLFLVLGQIPSNAVPLGHDVVDVNVEVNLNGEPLQEGQSEWALRTESPESIKPLPKGNLLYKLSPRMVKDLSCWQKGMSCGNENGNGMRQTILPCCSGLNCAYDQEWMGNTCQE